MKNEIDKKLFGSFTALIVVLYFEIRDLRLRVKNLENMLDQHIRDHTHQECEVQFTSD